MFVEKKMLHKKMNKNSRACFYTRRLCSRLRVARLLTHFFFAGLHLCCPSAGTLLKLFLHALHRTVPLPSWIASWILRRFVCVTMWSLNPSS